MQHKACDIFILKEIMESKALESADQIFLDAFDKHAKVKDPKMV